MLKFFRKHNKKLLAVFMALLLVVWLGGAALTSLVKPDRGESVVARSRFGDVCELDRRRALNLTGIWQRVGLPWQRPIGVTGSEPLTAHEWILLTREAQHLGFAPNPNDAESYLDRRGQRRPVINSIANRLEIAPEQVYSAVAEWQAVWAAATIVSQAAQVSEAEARVAARDTDEKVTVNLVAFPADRFVDEEAAFTDQELEAHFSKYREQEAGPGMTFGYYLPPRVKAEFVTVDVEKIKAGLRIAPKVLERKAKAYWKEDSNKEDRDRDRAFLRPPPQPTTQPATQPASQPTGPGDEPQAGEPITATRSPASRPAAVPSGEPQSVSSDHGQPVTRPEVDPSAGNAPITQPEPATSETPPPEQAPTQNPEPREETSGTDDQPDATDQPKPQPAQAPAEDQEPAELYGPPAPPALPPQPQFFETFAEAREVALDIVRTQEAQKEAQKVAEYLIQRITEPWFDVPLGDDNYKERPADVDAPGYYEAAVADPPPDLHYQGALTVGVTDWFSPEDARQVPSLGTASMAVPGEAPIAFARLAFQVQGLVELPRDADVDRSLFLALYEPCSVPLRDAAGNLHVYRIVAAEAARAPEALDELRDRVVADLGKQRAYDEAQRRANSLMAEADIDGLEAAFERDTDLQKILDTGNQVVKPQAFARTMAARNPAFAKTYIHRVGLVDETFTKPCFELGPAEEGKTPLAVIPLPEQSMVVLVEWRKLERMDRETYVGTRRSVISGIQQIRYAQSLSEWFDPELIRSRNRWEWDRGDRESD